MRPITHFLIIFILLATSVTVWAQPYKLQGTVLDAKLEPLSYVTVQIKELQIGTKTNNEGHFEFMLEEGEYEIVFSLLGFVKQSIKVVLSKKGLNERVLLAEEDKNLQEVKVVSFKKDRAEEIIRKVIKHKDSLHNRIESYAVDIYIRATQEDEKNISEKRLRKMTDSARQAYNSALPEMAMAEITLRLDYEYPNKTKEVRTGVNIRGNSESLFFLRTSEADFSLYNNLLKLPSLSQTPMLSPISYSGLVGYKYKTKRIDKKGNYTIYTIQFTPIGLSNALVEGEVDIIDTSWTILRSSFTIPKFHMPEYNYFQVKQQYDWVDGKTWLYVKQELTYKVKEGKHASSGRTVVVYDNYKLDTSFSKKYFNREVSKTTKEAYDKDSSFWETARKEPLTENEIKFVIQSDSLKRVTASKPYLDSIDRYRNKITWKRVFFTGVEHYVRKREEEYTFAPLISFVRPLFPGGTRIGSASSYYRIFPSKKQIRVDADLSYGLRNKDFQGNARWSYMYNPFNRAYIGGSFGRNFDFIFAGDAYINLFRRSNIYIRNNFSFYQGFEITNGLFWTTYVEFAKRDPLSQLTFGRELDSLYVINNEPIEFNSYNVFYLSTRLEFTPNQMYIREPKQKIILGSNYPTFYAYCRKGIPNVFQSETNFDYLEFGMRQTMKLGLAGILQYELYSGDFLNKKQLQFIDYKFIRRGDPFLFNNPMRSFQTIDSSFNVFNRFYQGHILHAFNGALLNKIPLLKRLKLLEVVGGGILILPERDLRFIEAFAGVEKSFSLWREKFKIGVYIAGSVANKYNNPFQLKLGFDQFNRQRNSWY